MNESGCKTNKQTNKRTKNPTSVLARLSQAATSLMFDFASNGENIKEDAVTFRPAITLDACLHIRSRQWSLTKLKKKKKKRCKINGELQNKCLHCTFFVLLLLNSSICWIKPILRRPVPLKLTGMVFHQKFHAGYSDFYNTVSVSA